MMEDFYGIEEDNNIIQSRFELLIFETASEYIERKKKEKEEQDERRLKEKEERDKKLIEIEKDGCCEGAFHSCDNKEKVEWTPAMTRYSWDIDKYPLEDPNRDLFLCEKCVEEYFTEWDYRWDEYYGGLL